MGGIWPNVCEWMRCLCTCRCCCVYPYDMHDSWVYACAMWVCMWACVCVGPYGVRMCSDVTVAVTVSAVGQGHVPRLSMGRLLRRFRLVCRKMSSNYELCIPSLLAGRRDPGRVPRLRSYLFRVLYTKLVLTILLERMGQFCASEIFHAHHKFFRPEPDCRQNKPMGHTQY